MSKKKKLKSEPKLEPPHGALPDTRYNELPDRLIKDQVLSAFKPGIRDSYVVEELVQTSKGTWIVKLVKLPEPLKQDV